MLCFLLHLSFATLTFCNLCFWLTLLHLVAAWLLFCSCYCIGTLIWFFPSLHDFLHLGVVCISTSLFCYFISLHLVFLAYLNVYCCGIDVILLLLLHWHPFISCFFDFASSYIILSLQLSLHFVTISTFILSHFVCCIVVFVFRLTLQLFSCLFLHHH